MGALLYGLLLGLGPWIIPGLLLGWFVRQIVTNLADWLGGMRLTIPLPLGEGITVDLASALSLSDTQVRLAALAAQEFALVLAVAVGTIAAGMLLTGMTAFFAAIFYNLFAGVFGGLEVKLQALDVEGRRAVGASIAASERSPAQTPIAPPRPRPEPAPRPGPTAWLASTAGNGERRPLREDVTRIGSAPQNDIVLPGLAPQHAEIRRESGRYLIYDLGSRRTWVNDTQVAAVHMLKDGFRLQLGQAEFMVHILTTTSTSAEA